MKKIFIYGAASAIAFETAKKFAQDGAELFLTDLKLNRLKAVKDDLIARFDVNIHLKEADALNYDDHQKVINEAIEKMGSIDIALIAHGTLPDQNKLESEPDLIKKEFEINCVSIISLASRIVNYFEKKGSGTLAVMSSVAGDRGRKSNYIYGSAKGALSIFLQGLRNRLGKTEIKIITIKPGMVDTPMTAHMPKGPLFASAEAVGSGVYEAIRSGKEIAYLPWYWRFIMLIIKIIPESIFKKLDLS